MVVVFTDEVLERIEHTHQKRIARLATKAAHMTVEPNYLTGGSIVRNPKIPGTIELVNEYGECTCQRHRVWGRCKHAALVKTRQG